MIADEVFTAFAFVASGSFAIWGQRYAAQIRVRPKPNPVVVQIVRGIACFVCLACAVNLYRMLVLSEPMK